ncbi:hypothetical protein [Mycoavidus sp. B2-EB]|uniref:hypothetical protein n=1 Tax=Mycoavidus sp. B2-EB TaxID=2651972 RepID=UPI0016265F15|nr:hypothetical protein [Mycoavidus sp. B2-EB]BBO59488.1 hypothetical protein MPB2EB_0607 [Mycoavidus sp. B2-EB]
MNRIHKPSTPSINSEEQAAQAQRTERSVTNHHVQARRRFGQYKGVLFRLSRAPISKSSNLRNLPQRRMPEQANHPILNANQHLPINTPNLSVSRDGGGQGRGQSHQEQQEQKKRKKESESSKAKLKVGYSKATRFSYHHDSESSTSSTPVSSVSALSRQEEKSPEETSTPARNSDAFDTVKALPPSANLAKAREILMQISSKEKRDLKDISPAEQNKNLLAALRLMPAPMLKPGLRKAREEMLDRRRMSMPKAAPAA